MRFTPFIAVDCGASRVTWALFSAERGGRRELRKCVVEPLDEGWTTEKEWLDETTGALRRIAARAGFRGRAGLALPGHVTLAKHVTTPAIAAANRARILRFEAAQNIPHPIEEVVWDCRVTEEAERELSVLLMAAKTDIVTGLCAAVERTGLRVMQVWPSWLAIVRGHHLDCAERDGSVLLVDVGARSTQLMWLDGARMRVRILSFGGRSVTLAIAGELQIDAAEAEELKRAVNSGASELPADSPFRRAVRRAGEAFGERLQREIMRTVLSAPRRAAPGPPAAIRLLGDGSRLETLPGQLGAGLRLPVEREAVRHGADEASSSPLFSDGLIGLASHRAEPGVNLLPETIRAERRLRARQYRWLAAAVLVALALLPAILLEDRRAAEDRARTAEIELRLRPRRELARRNAAALVQLAEIDRQRAERHARLAARSQWRRFLADLQDRLAMAGDVWLETFAVVHSGEHPAGATVGAPGGDSNLRFRVGGKLLDWPDAPDSGGAGAQQRLRRLLASFERSPFVAAVEEERFENGETGLVHFEVNLVAAADQPW